jgi:transcriptional regulator with PAS, ATPase and Fis domain
VRERHREQRSGRENDRPLDQVLELADISRPGVLQPYVWPGNVRELQNVIERSIIVCETAATLAVDETWLRHESREAALRAQPLADELVARETKMIEAALTRSKGRVSGPSGAAAQLGIPSSTLESKIRALGIKKDRFKGS